MELKSLKIDSDLHEKIKSLSDEKNTSMQNLVEKKLLELISHEEDILFTIKNITYDKQFKIFNLQLEEEAFKKLINFFEIFLTNRNLKNINEIENLLKLISNMKSELDITKNHSNKIESKIKNTEESLVDMINKVTKEHNINNVNKDETKFDYSYIEKSYNNGLKNLLTQLDSVRFSMAKDNLSEAYETLNGHTFIEPDKKTADDIKKENNKILFEIDLDMRSKIEKPHYLSIGDILKDPKKDLEYEVVKIYDNENFVLKGVSEIIKDVESFYTKQKLIDCNFLINDILLLEMIDKIDFEYNKNISKLMSFKEAALNVKLDMTSFINKNKSEYSNEDITNLENKIQFLETTLKEEIVVEKMKESYIKTKIWFEEFKIK